MGDAATDERGAGAPSGDPRHAARRTRRAAAALLIGACAGLTVMVALIRALPRDPATAGLGLNTTAVSEAHPRGLFQFDTLTGKEFATAARHFAGSRKVLWLGASQLFGINKYRPPQHNVAYRVFDALIGEGTAVLTLSFPLASPQEHDVMLSALIGRAHLSGLIIGAAFGDMRDAGLRQSVANALDDPQARARLAQTAHGQRLIAAAAAKQRRDAVAQPAQSDRSPMERTEARITGRLQHWFGLEDFRRAGRAWVLLGLQQMRRYFESLRARYTRDLSHYHVPILKRDYDANWASWQHMLAMAKAEGVPTLVYIAPRPTDFFPFDPTLYVKYKRELAALAARNGAAFVNIEDAVPNKYWGLVDIGFGFYARDPFHFTAEGHALMAEALLPHIRRLIENTDTR